ncbi:hypothetical protein TNIN_43831 [Trichonephila inaurata madagascariensis]|uniref:Uncharacterized protein n=1 Tax=Trichonephila inaurata madagascariensis TaxID=2747483 RepID=A0A8X7BQX5_9ARAC|nr:hypothetical protein TNIN_43831 [Trichonephila inaurata madagascariensis]
MFGNRMGVRSLCMSETKCIASTVIISIIIIIFEILQPCSKREDTNVLKRKGLDKIEKRFQENVAVAYTNGVL